MKNILPLLACLLVGASALADAPPSKHSPHPRKSRARPCQGQVPQRSVWPQGTLLWGTGRKVVAEEMSTILSSVDLGQMQLGGKALKGLRLEKGLLEAPSRTSEQLVGALLQGTDSDGQPVQVALCGAEPVTGDPGMVWYRIELWNVRSASWENPCVATNRVPVPRALAVRGVWDETGTHHEVPGKFTFACENGAIAKCITWGYKPWATKGGHSLADLHQACTRMARADYCGDGRSHTREDTPVDMYDGLQVLTRVTEATSSWDPERASFEAAWTPDGAWCLARTRHGQSVETVLTQCPGRFELAEKDLGEGDRCMALRKESPHKESPHPELLRNHSYGKNAQSPTQGSAP